MRTKMRELLRLPARVERPRDVFNPTVLNVCLGPWGVASYRTPHQQKVFLRRHPIDLNTNATPLRPGSWLPAMCQGLSPEKDSRGSVEIFVLAPLTWSGHHE
jgi:hypothetical protein